MTSEGFMKISVYSKAAIERIIAEGKFPKDTAVETLLLKQSFEKDDCYHSLEEAYFRLRHDIAKVNVSLHIDDARNENFKTS